MAWLLVALTAVVCILAEFALKQRDKRRNKKRSKDGAASEPTSLRPHDADRF